MRSLLLTVCVVLGMSATAQNYVIYPNASAGVFRIKLSEPDDIDLWYELSRIIIIDESGKLLYDKKYGYHIQGRNIEVKKPESGVYFFILFYSWELVETHKIVVK
jgi:hypothetical protein